MGLISAEVITHLLRGIIRIFNFRLGFLGLKIEVMDLSGHNNDPGDQASGYVVSKGNTYAQTRVPVCFPFIVSLNLLTHTAKVDLGIVI